MKKNKLLIITPFPNSGPHQYPHVRYLTDFCEIHYDCDIFIFEERGLEIHKKLFKINFFKYGLSSVRKNFNFILQFFQLRRLSRKYDNAISIDNFIFINTVFAGFKNSYLWSHDFITKDNHLYNRKIYRILNFLLVYCLKKHPNLIIQDKNRLNLFKLTYDITNKLKVFELPLVLPPVKIEKKIEYKIPQILQIGGINGGRSQSDLLVKYFTEKNIDYSLKFHGYIDYKIFEREPRLMNIEISETFLEPNEMYHVLQQCQIGVISYNINDLNFFNIRFASNQLVEFLRNGKPVIVLGNSDLNSFVSENGIGIFINNQREFEKAIIEITENYQTYCIEVINCYNKYFNMENYSNSLLNYLRNE